MRQGLTSCRVQATHHTERYLKATGFKWSAVLPKKSHLPQAFTGYCDFMFQHGYILSHFKSDDEALYKTPEMRSLYSKYKIRATHSSPHLHQWNDLAEASNKKSENMVTSMLSCARHLSEVFWSKAWKQADLIYSLGPCSIKGKEHMTRFEPSNSRLSFIFPKTKEVIFLINPSEYPILVHH